MVKPAIKPAPESASAPPLQPTVLCDIWPEVWARCFHDLHAKLARAITNSPETGDVGRISSIVADIRAMELIRPMRGPPPPQPEREPTPEDRRLADVRREQQEAAADPVKMRAYNAKIARRESIDAAREDSGS